MIGRPPNFRLLFIIGTSAFLLLFIIGTTAFTGGRAVLAFDKGCPRALRISSADGIPGVGVVPGLCFRFNSSGLGIPGVGDPFGTGVEFEADPGETGDGEIGSNEIPGGIFGGSMAAG